MKEMTQEEIQDRMESCPWRERPTGEPYVCTRYVDTTVLCNGACSWVVDYPRLNEIKKKYGNEGSN